jgi:hypothetical protein
MTDFAVVELRNIDPDDISGVLVKVEKSFGIKFGSTELIDVSTFGDLCDIIINKVGGNDISDCTTQQAFYKLRSAISATLQIDKTNITPDSGLAELFQRPHRRQNVAAVENELGFKIKVLHPKDWIRETFVLTHVISIIVLFAVWKIGLAGLLFSIIGQGLANKFGKEMDLQTLGELAKKISRENYLRARRNSSSINKNEITAKVQLLFSTDLSLAESFLRREASFI